MPKGWVRLGSLEGGWAQVRGPEARALPFHCRSHWTVFRAQFRRCRRSRPPRSPSRKDAAPRQPGRPGTQLLLPASGPVTMSSTAPRGCVTRAASAGGWTASAPPLAWAAKVSSLQLPWAPPPHAHGSHPYSHARMVCWSLGTTL